MSLDGLCPRNALASSSFLSAKSHDESEGGTMGVWQNLMKVYRETRLQLFQMKW